MIVSENEIKITFSKDGNMQYSSDSTLTMLSAQLSALVDSAGMHNLEINKIFEISKISSANKLSVNKLMEFKNMEINSKKYLWFILSKEYGVNNQNVLSATKELLEKFKGKMEDARIFDLKGDEKSSFDKEVNKILAKPKINSITVSPDQLMLSDDIIYFPEEIIGSTQRIFALDMIMLVASLLELKEDPLLKKYINDTSNQWIISNDESKKYLLITKNIKEKITELSAPNLAIIKLKNLLKNNNELENYFLANEVIKYLNENYLFSIENYNEYSELLAQARECKKKDKIYEFEKAFNSIISIPATATEASLTNIPVSYVFDYLAKANIKDKSQRITAIFKSIKPELFHLLVKKQIRKNGNELIKNIMINSASIADFPEILAGILKTILETPGLNPRELFETIKNNAMNEEIKKIILSENIKSINELYLALKPAEKKGKLWANQENSEIIKTAVKKIIMQRK